MNKYICREFPPLSIRGSVVAAPTKTRGGGGGWFLVVCLIFFKEGILEQNRNWKFLGHARNWQASPIYQPWQSPQELHSISRPWLYWRRRWGRRPRSTAATTAGAAPRRDRPPQRPRLVPGDRGVLLRQAPRPRLPAAAEPDRVQSRWQHRRLVRHPRHGPRGAQQDPEAHGSPRQGVPHLGQPQRDRDTRCRERRLPGPSGFRLHHVQDLRRPVKVFPSLGIRMKPKITRKLVILWTSLCFRSVKVKKEFL